MASELGACGFGANCSGNYLVEQALGGFVISLFFLVITKVLLGARRNLGDDPLPSD